MKSEIIITVQYSIIFEGDISGVIYIATVLYYVPTVLVHYLPMLVLC